MIRTSKLQSSPKKTSTFSPSPSSSRSSPDAKQETQTAIRKIDRHPQKGLLLKVKINHQHYVIDPDSGSDANIMDESHFKEINQNNKLTLRPIQKSDKLAAVNNEPLDLKGKFTTEISSPSRTIKSTFYVLKNPLNSPPLLSEETLLHLGMLRYCPAGSFASPSVKSVDIKDTLTELQQQHPTVFFGKLGKFTGFQVDLRLEKDAQPMIARARVLPLHLEVPTRKAIDSFVDLEILEWTPIGTAIRFASAIVVVLKKNKEEVRLTIDFRYLNSCLSRARITSKVNLDTLVKTLCGYRLFFKVDIRHAFYTLELTKRSRALTSIATPWGTLQFTRLPMGIKSSSDYFDSAMSVVLSGVPQVIFYRDDILAAARDKEDHDRVLRIVIGRLSEHGFTIDPTKSLFYQESISFLGFRFTKEGVAPDPAKVESIRQAPKPQSKEALISFLCALAFNERFVHRFAEKASSLHDLARSSGPLVWTPATTQAFEELKASLIAEALNKHFDRDKQTCVYVDAGKNAHTIGKRGGFSGVLCQRRSHKDPWEAVCFASKRMTDVQSRWSQAEVECGALTWALTEKFLYYLSGCPRFVVFTDCRCLVPLFNSETRNAPPRIERMILKCQGLDFYLEYLPGKRNPADFLSRNPHQEPGNDHDEERLIKYIRSTNKPPITWDELRSGTTNCEILQKLIKNIAENKWPKDKDTMPYKGIKDELSYIDGILFRGSQIVIPDSLKTEIITKAHKIIPPEPMRPGIADVHHKTGHQGVKQTAKLLRQRFWWPGYTVAVEKAVRACPGCQFITPDQRKDPLVHVPLPPAPFHSLSADFKGPLENGMHLLVIKDSYSKWVEVYPCTGTSLKAVRKFFLRFFSSHGDCAFLKTDGGPPFNSEEFEQFSKKHGFTHHKTVPLNPRQNGEVEVFMKKLKRTVQLSMKLKLNFEEELNRQLQAYRATPHSTTGKSPAELAGKTSFRMNALGDSDSRVMDTPPDRQELEEIVTQQKKKNEKTGRNIKPHDFTVGDKVIVRLDKKYSSAPLYAKDIYTITEVRGTSIKAKTEDGQLIHRNAERFKHYVPPLDIQPPQTPTKKSEEQAPPAIPRLQPQAQDPADPDPPTRTTRSSGTPDNQPWIMGSKKRPRKKK